MTSVMLKAHLAEATRQYQVALETKRRMQQVVDAELMLNPLEAAPLLHEAERHVEEHRKRMETAWEMAR